VAKGSAVRPWTADERGERRGGVSIVVGWRTWVNDMRMLGEMCAPDPFHAANGHTKCPR